MLTFQDQFRQAGRLRRREFLRVGGLALGGLTLSDWMATHALLDIGEVRLMPGVPPRVVEAMTRGEPIRGLI